MKTKTTPNASRATTRSKAPKPQAKAPAKGSLSPTSPEGSTSVRKIANGYVISQSSFDKKGNYQSKETFSPKPPSITITPAKG